MCVGGGVKLANRKLKLPSGNRGREYVQNKNATNAKRNLALRRPSDLLSLAINAVLCTRAVQFAVVVDVGDNRLPVQENKNNNAWLSDSETRIACLFAMCRCARPCGQCVVARRCCITRCYCSAAAAAADVKQFTD